ncbi:hypothetical protein ACHAWT_010633 [Skeletonema menzelii]
MPCSSMYEWEELATKIKGFVKIAYWDTEKSGPVPAVLGEIRGTPTIKLLVPKRKARTNKQKNVVDYNMERKADDMIQFALDSMPSFVERISGPGDFENFKKKANKYGLPMMLVFSENRIFMNEMKYLSTEFRRRALVAHISLSKKENRNIFFEYGVRGQALITSAPHTDGEEKQNLVTFDGKWNLHRLRSFFAEHALKTEVKPKPKPDEAKKEDVPQQKQKVKTEL